MKPVLLLSLLLIGPAAMAQTLPDKLNGQVKKVEQFSYRQEPAEESYLLSHSCDSFNRQGKLLETLYFKDFRQLVKSRYQYTYDAKGNTIGSTSWEEEGLVQETDEMRYDAKGNKVEWTIYGPNRKKLSRKQFVYNKANQLVEQKRFDSNGVLEFRIHYRYDEKGNEVEYWREQPQGQRLYRYLYKYDSKGLMQTQHYEDEKQPDKNTSVKYTYDEQGHLSKIEEYDSKQMLVLTAKVGWIFDAQKNWTARYDSEEHFYEKGSYTMEMKIQRVITYY